MGFQAFNKVGKIGRDPLGRIRFPDDGFHVDIFGVEMLLADGFVRKQPMQKQAKAVEKGIRNHVAFLNQMFRLSA